MIIKKRSLHDVLPFPIDAEGVQYSLIASLHDDPASPTKSLLNLSIKAIQNAMEADLSDISQRVKEPPVYSEIWPGEHYKLLAGLVQALQPQCVIEIGTATGLSALSLKKFLSVNGKLITFDLVPWEEEEKAVLKKEDFTEQFVQYIDDLTSFDTCSKYHDLLKQADLVFIDATHDGHTEKKLLDNFTKIGFQKKVYLLFDDIRLWTMLKMWRDITFPKIDLTSFGHWSGTGLVELFP